MKRRIDSSTEQECRKILQSLFLGIVNPSVLQQNDLFSIDLGKDDALTMLRNRIQKLGCSLHKENVEKHYERFYNDDSSRSSSSRGGSSTMEAASLLMGTNESHRVLTERFNIPLLLPALQDITRAIVNLSTTVPELLQLQKYGGSKGTSKRLVTITPASTEKGLYLNAYRWLPQVLDASVLEDSTGSSTELASRYHIVSTLIQVLANMDKDAFIDSSNSLKAGAAKPKMDATIHKAMVYDAHLSQTQFKLIRKYVIHTLGYNPFQPESAIRDLDVGLFDATIVPFKDCNRKRMAYYRPIDALFK
jgi:hypothetical protein